jgi:hypothetical protein
VYAIDEDVMREQHLARRNRLVPIVSLISIFVAALFVVSVTTQAQKYPPSFPRLGARNVPPQPGQNPRLDIEIWEVIRMKGHPSPMYELPMDQVAVTLTEGAIKYTRPDGTVRIEHERFGEVRFESKGTVLQEEGLNELASRSMVFQIKNGQHAHLAPPTPGIPGQWPRIDATKLFETETFNVWEELWLPDRPIFKHLHYNQAAYVMLNGGVLRGVQEGQKFTEPPSMGASNWRTGYVLTMGPVTVPHEEEWVAGNPRAVWVELK